VKVSAREKKMLYAGIVIAAAILIYWAWPESSDDGVSLSKKVENQESKLRKYREEIGLEDTYRKRIEAAEKDLEKLYDRLLPGNNSVAAVTELQRILNDFADRSGIVITSKSNLPDRKVVDSDSLIKVSVRNGIDCSNVAECRIEEDLVDFLTSIKNFDKFLKVEEIVIQTSMQQNRLRVRRPISMTIAGYINAPPPAESEAKPGENPVQTSSTARETRR